MDGGATRLVPTPTKAAFEVPLCHYPAGLGSTEVHPWGIGQERTSQGTMMALIPHSELVARVRIESDVKGCI